MALAVAPAVLAQTRSIPAFVVPTFADLTIKKRHSFDTASSVAFNEVLYLKGARQRHEFFYEQLGNVTHDHVVTVTQCDQRRSVQLNPESKLFGVSVFRDWSQPLQRQLPPPEPRGADVTNTFDAVDTGERRRVGRYVARRVRTTVTVEPSPGANTPASTQETDGWYIDLPGLGCSHAEPTETKNVIVGPGGLIDRHHYKTKGAARRGYAIEETNRYTQTALSHIYKVELIELSEHLLDSSLFDIPRDYRPALPLGPSGYDMTKPDTVANRLQMYWDRVASVTRAILR